MLNLMANIQMADKLDQTQQLKETDLKEELEEIGEDIIIITVTVVQDKDQQYSLAKMIKMQRRAQLLPSKGRKFYFDYLKFILLSHHIIIFVVINII